MKGKLIIIMVLVLCLPLSIIARDTVNITTGQWPPYLGENNADDGFAADVIRKAFDAVDIDISLGYFPFQRSYDYAKAGKSNNQVWHAAMVWMYTDERAESFMYSDVLITDYEVLYHLKDQPLEWKTVEDLRGMVIGGTQHAKYFMLEDADRDRIITLERSGDYLTLFKRLLKRRIDAVPHVINVAEYFLRTSLTADERSKITYSENAIGKREYHLIFSKNVPENSEYLKQFNKGLSIIKSNGVYDELVKKFSAGYYD